MIYAMRTGIYGDKTVVEFKSRKEMIQQDLDDPIHTYHRCTSEHARNLVKRGFQHETGLWVDNGKVKYARPNP